jgi:hypothetical protein
LRQGDTAPEHRGERPGEQTDKVLGKERPNQRYSAFYNVEDRVKSRLSRPFLVDFKGLKNGHSRLDKGDELLAEDVEVSCVSSATTQTGFFLRDVQDQVASGFKFTPEIAGIGSQGLVDGRKLDLTINLVCKQQYIL